MGIFTRLFGTGEGDDGDDAAERETSIGPELAVAGVGASTAKGTLMATKPEEPTPRRAPLPSLPRHKPDEKPKPTVDKHDATMINAAPPPPRPTPPPRAAVVAPPPVRKKPDSLDINLDEVVMEISQDTQVVDIELKKPASHGVSTASDLESVRKLFEEVAVAHVAQVRDVMLELRFGEANPRWIEMTKPALKSLRTMAKEMDLVDLTTSLDEFCAAVDSAVASRMIDDAGKAALLQKYQRLIELIPQAFELDAERDRREPVIVEALLSQIDGVERPIIDKLFAVGLGRLEALVNSNAGDVAAVCGLRIELATKIVEHFKAYRASAPSTVAAPDAQGEKRKLHDLLIALSLENDNFNKASSEWGDEANQKKKMSRKLRDQTFQEIKVALARLGERALIARLEKMAFSDRIAAIDSWLSAQPRQGAS